MTLNALVRNLDSKREDCSQFLKKNFHAAKEMIKDGKIFLENEKGQTAIIEHHSIVKSVVIVKGSNHLEYYRYLPRSNHFEQVHIAKEVSGVPIFRSVKSK
ncbi:hypothetical protein P5637_07185 [Bacillus paralicheniformis]|uniref:hypothetical protein n=1 Tax=Bacillus paralicheniformis TaxID=1648923 RepID=UPI0011789927|nr:hypothetical protein [Bacillus paralicheniformis]WEZ25557.1 hypothetical protein P5637_07185 [Bacillus paralicheniformis]